MSDTQASASVSATELTVDQALQQGVAHHKAGQLSEAERAYRAILQVQPQHPDGHEYASVAVQGVPAPAYLLPDNSTSNDGQDFVPMIRVVNERLRQGAGASGWRFLAVYAATVGDDDLSHGKCHIDGNHLQPAFYINSMRCLV